MAMELEVLGEGEQISSSEHLFCQIGEPLPIGGGGIYDSENPPAHPLAVSQRYGLLFVAHSNGFYVARTKEVMAAAEAFKKKKGSSSLSVEELSTLNISSIGRVSILSLSSLDSWLAASVDHHIHFFSMIALRHNDDHASFSVDLDQSVKDIKWAPHAALERHYIALSTAGTLYHGSGPASPDTLRTDVDSVEWSPNGDFIVVAQKNIITLLFSPKFEESKFMEKTCFSLSPASIIVDSIRWVSARRIILGCFDQEDDPDQPTYIVQVISTHDKDITNISSKPSMVVFNDMFLNYQSDVAPSATGPSLFVSYLENCELAIVANRKNLSEHVVLLGEDKNREAAMIELVNDAWRPSILTQENGDDNLVLALSVDKVSHDEKRKFILGEQQIEVSPCRILLCVTVDGKIHLFHFASAADSNGSDSDGKQDKHQVLSENRQEQNTLHSSPAQEHDGLSYVKPYDIQDNNAGIVSSTQSSSINSIKIKEKSSFGNQTHDSAFSFQEARDDTQPSELAKYPISHTEHSPSKDSVMKARDVWKTETPAISEAKAQADVMSATLPTDFSSQSVSKSIPAPIGIATFSSSLRNSFPLRASDDGSTSSLTFGAVSQSPSRSEETSAPAARLSFPGLKAAAALVDNRSSSPANHNSQILSQQIKVSGKFIRDENIIATSYPERSNHEQQLSSQFSNVEVLVQKMDQLLEDIQGCGGFMDASITSQEGSVAALEEGLSLMSEQCRMWRGTLGGRLKEIQLLLDKTVQVRARQVYMEGIFQQANDNWYSELWNSQKLCLELDLKRQHIVEVDQELASQLVQLERHFNAIEFNKVGESTVFKPRQQFLRSLQNTMSAQLFAAEKLSVRLSEQMAALNLQSQDSKQNAKREVFETLGLPYDGAYNSSVKGKASDTPRKDLMMNSSSITAKQVCSTNLYTPVKNSEPQTVRRQRKSLEQLKFSPVREKVTLKRIFLQEDHIKCENRLGTEAKDLNLRRVSPVSYGFSEASEKSKFQYKSKNSSKISANQFNEGFSTPSYHWTEEVAGSRTEDVSAKSPETCTTRLYGSEKNHTKSWKLPGKASGSDAEYAQESQNSPSDIPSISERTPVSMSSASNGLGTFRSANEEVKTTPVHEFHIPDSIFSQSALVSSGFSSPLFSSGKVLETEVSAGEIRLGQKISFPVLQSNTSASNQVSSSATSTPSPIMTAKSHDTDLSSSSHTDQKKLQSHSLFSSYPSQQLERVNHSSGTHNFVKESLETPESGSQPTADVFGTSRSDDSSVKQTSISSSSLAREEMPKAEASVLLHGIPNASSSSLSSVSEISSSQANKSAQSQANGNQPKLEVTASEMKPNSTYRQPLISRNSSLAPIPSGTLLVGEDLTNNEEDEMEEEAPESNLTPELKLGNLGAFGFGSSSSSSSSNTSKPNPFGVGMINNSAAPVAMTTQPGELFRPASFNIQSAFPSQPSIAANTSPFASGFGSGSSSLGPPSSGFGQPAQFGSGQQALGSVLGAFGQSRQLGASPPGNSIAPTSGGFSSLGSGGFASLSTGGGFGAAATAGGGFAAMAGGGFAAAAGTGGGFAAAAGTGGGFAAAAHTGGGFAAAGGAFGNPVGGFSAFGNSSGAGGPPPNLFTEMRK